MKNRYEKDFFTKIVKESINLSDVCRKLNISTSKGNRDTVKKYINIYNIDISHFRYQSNTQINNFKKIDIIDILIEKSSYKWTTILKKRLYKEGLKERKCELCGQDENWNGMKISLILDHINGINNDNRIENLRIVCPNCNAGLSTFSGKNINNEFKYKKNINKYKTYISNIKKCECGNIIDHRSILCKKCLSIKQRKVERPSYEQLLKEIKELGYSGTGRKYGVSDNAIRKWIKNYQTK